jgi:hypothetical protein
MLAPFHPERLRWPAAGSTNFFNTCASRPIDIIRDIYFIAQNPGLFAPRCADHDCAGMTATIVID